MRRLILGFILLLGLSAPALAASTPDPCVSSSFKNSVSISVSSATTTALVTVVANKAVWICGFVLNIPGSGTSAATAQLEYGTGTACASGVNAITGAFGSNDAAASTTPTTVQYGNGGATIAIAPPGNGVCVLTAGTTVLVTGILTYVQATGGGFP